MSFRLPGSGTIRIDETDISIPVSLRSATNGAGVTGLDASSVTLSYWRQGGIPVSITTSSLATSGSAHSDGGFIETSVSLQPGLYRLDVPDAAFANGADWVTVDVEAPTTAGAKYAFTLTADGQLRSGAAQAGSKSTDIVLDGSASNDTQAYQYANVYIAAGSGAGQMRVIESYNTTTKRAKVFPSWVSIPTTASTFVVSADYGPQSLLSHSISTNEADQRYVGDAINALRNKVDVTGSTGTVYQGDDATASYTFAITRSAVNPIVKADP